MLAAIRDAEQVTVSDDELRERIKEDAAMLQRDPNQLVLDVYASGRRNLLRDELVIAKTIDFLVEHATAVSPKPADADAAKAAGDEPAGKAAKGGRASRPGKAGKSGKADKAGMSAAATTDEATKAKGADAADEADAAEEADNE